MRWIRLPVVTGQSHFARADPPCVPKPRPDLLARSSGVRHCAMPQALYSRIVCPAWAAAQRRMQSVQPRHATPRTRPAPPRPVHKRCTRRMPSDAVVIQRSPAIVRGAGTFAVSAQSPTSTDMRRRRGLARDADIVCDRSKSPRCRSRLRGKGISCQIWIQRSGVPAETCPTGGRYTLRSSTSRYW